jgi:hypothetical protein
MEDDDGRHDRGEVRRKPAARGGRSLARRRDAKRACSRDAWSRNRGQASPAARVTPGCDAPDPSRRLRRVGPTAAVASSSPGMVPMATTTMSPAATPNHGVTAARCCRRRCNPVAREGERQDQRRRRHQGAARAARRRPRWHSSTGGERVSSRGRRSRVGWNTATMSPQSQRRTRLGRPAARRRRAGRVILRILASPGTIAVRKATLT